MCAVVSPWPFDVAVRNVRVTVSGDVGRVPANGARPVREPGAADAGAHCEHDSLRFSRWYDPATHRERHTAVDKRRCRQAARGRSAISSRL